MKRVLTDIYVRRWVTLIVLIIVLWGFRYHLKDLASLMWPVIAATVIFNFRAEITALLRRTKRIGKEGAEFEASSVAAQIMAQPVEQAMREVAPGESNSPYILQRVEAIRNELNVQAGTDQQRRENLLTLRFAQAQQARAFQAVWLNIFSSQIDALAKMSQGNDLIELTDYFDAHLVRVKQLPNPPAVPVTFDIWSSYLVRMNLIYLDGTRGAITQQGRDFLTFSTQQNLPRFQGL